jgi:hypothetical protein
MTGEELQKQADEINKAMTGQEIPYLSPLEEMKLLDANVAKNLQLLQDERIKIEKAASDLILSGKSFAGQKPIELTQDQKDQLAADKIINQFKL